jgi:hypothetical protein
MPCSKVPESTSNAATQSNSGFRAGFDQRLNISSESPSEESWATALEEFENNARRPGLWARVFAEANGEESVAKAAYLSRRAAELHEEYLNIISPNVIQDQFETQMRIAKQYFNSRNSSVENYRMATSILQTLANRGVVDAKALLKQLNEEMK